MNAEPSVADIVRAVCAGADVTEAELRSQRQGRYCLPRHLVFWLAWTTTTRTTAEISRALGKDPSSVGHGIQRVERLAIGDPAFAARLQAWRAWVDAAVERNPEPVREAA